MCEEKQPCCVDTQTMGCDPGEVPHTSRCSGGIWTLPLSVFQQGFPRGEQPRTYLPSLPSAALPELSSLAAPPSWLCRLRFPSAPRFLPWHHRGADCGLPADKTKPLFPSLLKINNNKKTQLPATTRRPLTEGPAARNMAAAAPPS